MKKRLFALLLVSIVFLGSSAFIVKSSGGITGVTGAPGESGCSCHGGSLSTSIIIAGTPAFTGNQYIAGQTYTVNITVSNASFSRFGFDAEILNALNTNAGTMVSGLTGVQVVNTARKNATHTTPKVGVGSAVFSFIWVAPVSGNATIYVAGNAINGTGTTAGDAPNIGNLPLTQNTTGIAEETFQSGFSGISVYPNPVISDFKVQYNLMNDGDVKVSLFDLHGKEIAEIVNEKQSSGHHILNASLPSDLAKGVYFVKLSLNGKTSAQRLIITQ